MMMAASVLPVMVVMMMMMVMMTASVQPCALMLNGPRTNIGSQSRTFSPLLSFLVWRKFQVNFFIWWSKFKMAFDGDNTDDDDDDKKMSMMIQFCEGTLVFLVEESLWICMSCRKTVGLRNRNKNLFKYKWNTGRKSISVHFQLGQKTLLQNTKLDIGKYIVFCVQDSERKSGCESLDCSSLHFVSIHSMNDF